MKKMMAIVTGVLFIAVYISCNSSSDSGNTGTLPQDTATYFDTTTGVSLQREREMQMNMIIEAARMTLDSINSAYTLVFNSSKTMSLSVDERQQLNFALQQMNDTRELIILETQKEVLDNLQEKAASFKSMVKSMGVKSTKLINIARSLTHLSDLIQHTTDALADAFSSGIIKPKLDALSGK
ncbi:MAG: hypothetical protein JST09_15665 [Bacteroidetes bacterium]|nr:hypothetical protein [Bacteroidota bacterium]